MDSDSKRHEPAANGEDEPTQTTPKGVEIPVPNREDVLRDLEKLAAPPPRKKS